MRRIAWLGLVCAIASCGDSTGPSAERLVLPDIRGMVAGNALDALDRNGRFRPPEPWSPSPRPLISPEFALAIAEITLRDFVVNGSGILPCSGGFSCQTMREVIEETWCRRIDWDRARTSRDYWFFGTPPTSAPADSLIQSVLNFWGPKYFVPVLHGADWIATIIVAAHATNVTITGEGRLKLNGPGGDEIEIQEGSCHYGAGTPPAPEEAVAFAASVTGRKVVEVPSLYLPGVLVGPGGVRWRIVLDEPVTVRTLADGTVHETNEVYVAVWPDISEANELPANRRGGGLRLSIAAESQPDFEVRPVSPMGELVFPRRLEAPLHLREVEVVR